MTIDPNILLKQLEPAVRPSYAGARTGGPAAPLEHQPFDELLARAARGGIESGRPVSAAYETPEPLSPQQIERLSSAADLVEATGAQRALLLVDGRGLVLDIPSRTLSADLSADAASRVVSLDAAMYVAGESDESRGPVLPPPGGVAPRGVAEQIDAVKSNPPAAA
jgi:hypothetical protein